MPATHMHRKRLGRVRGVRAERYHKPYCPDFIHEVVVDLESLKPQGLSLTLQILQARAMSWKRTCPECPFKFVRSERDVSVIMLFFFCPSYRTWVSCVNSADICVL